MKTLKIAVLTPDKRDHDRDYSNPIPNFGTAPSALLDGFEMLSRDWSGLKKQNECAEGLSTGDYSFTCNYEIHVISCTQKMMPAPAKLAPNIWFHSLYVPKSGWLRSGYLGCAMAVRQKLSEIKPDLIHAQGTERDCAISAVLSHYPKLLTIHGNLRLIKKQIGFRPLSALWFQSFLEGLVVPRFDGVICITNYTQAAVENEVPKTWVVPNAVDPSFLELGKKRLADSCARPSTLDSRPQCPIILVVANVDERKNQNVFIRALDPLAKKMNFEVRFFGGCGASDYAREFRELIASRPWCFHGGMIGREELRREFETASMLALPT
ncbi:MAG: glycosyltransferase, partial [Chlamydiia bacterium]